MPPYMGRGCVPGHSGGGVSPSVSEKRKGVYPKERKMPSQGSITKTIRINAEDRAVIEQMIEDTGCTWSGAIHRLITEGVPQKEEKKVEGCTPKQRNEGVPQIMSEDTYRDLEQMCKLSGLTFDKFMDYIRRLFNDGRIYIEGIAVKTRGEYDLDYLIDVCHRINVDPQEMINKLANNLVRR